MVAHIYNPSTQEAEGRRIAREVRSAWDIEWDSSSKPTSLPQPKKKRRWGCSLVVEHFPARVKPWIWSLVPQEEKSLPRIPDLNLVPLWRPHFFIRYFLYIHSCLNLSWPLKGQDSRRGGGLLQWDRMKPQRGNNNFSSSSSFSSDWVKYHMFVEAYHTFCYQFRKWFTLSYWIFYCL
jgi:hypothetical protein